MSALFNEIPEVYEFHETGDHPCFYVFIRLSSKDDSGATKTIVAMGRNRFGHSYIADNFWHYHVEGKNIDIDISGGGFIDINETEKKMCVFGKSERYGHANHDLAVAILSNFFPEWDIKNTTPP